MFRVDNMITYRRDIVGLPINLYKRGAVWDNLFVSSRYRIAVCNKALRASDSAAQWLFLTIPLIILLYLSKTNIQNHRSTPNIPVCSAKWSMWCSVVLSIVMGKHPSSMTTPKIKSFITCSRVPFGNACDPGQIPRRIASSIETTRPSRRLSANMSLSSARCTTGTHPLNSVGSNTKKIFNLCLVFQQYILFFQKDVFPLKSLSL